MDVPMEESEAGPLVWTWHSTHVRWHLVSATQQVEQAGNLAGVVKLQYSTATAVSQMGATSALLLWTQLTAGNTCRYSGQCIQSKLPSISRQHMQVQCNTCRCSATLAGAVQHMQEQWTARSNNVADNQSHCCSIIPHSKGTATKQGYTSMCTRTKRAGYFP